MNNQEVEVRALISDKNVQSKLIAMGAVKKGVKDLTDTYYCLNNVTSFEQTEMNAVGSFSLRLRNDESHCTVNIKVITNKGDHNSWEEHETEFENFKEMEIILKQLGYKEFFRLEKKRVIYTLKQFEIVIEDIKDFQEVIEVEAMTTKSNAQAEKELILKFLSDLGITEIVEKSVTNMLGC